MKSEKKGPNCDERVVLDTEILDFRFLNQMSLDFRVLEVQARKGWRVRFLQRK